MSSQGQKRGGSAIQLPKLPKENHSSPLLRFLAHSPLRGDAQSGHCVLFARVCSLSHYPPFSLKASVMDVGFDLCSVSSNKALHFPRGRHGKVACLLPRGVCFCERSCSFSCRWGCWGMQTRRSWVKAGCTHCQSTCFDLVALVLVRNLKHIVFKHIPTRLVVFKGFLQDPEEPGNELLLKCGVNVAAWKCLACWCCVMFWF